jgi:hypothetical protein
MLNRLIGTKTFWVAVGLVVTNVGMAAGGIVEWSVAINLILAGLGLGAFRDAFAKEELNLVSSFAVAQQPDVWDSWAGRFIIDLVKKLVPAPLVTPALLVVKSVASQYVSADHTRAIELEIVTKVHQALKQADLINKKPPISTVAIVGLVLIFLVGCAPLFTRMANTHAAGGATIIYTNEGAVFNPNAQQYGAAVNVVFDLQGVGVQLALEVVDSESAIEANQGCYTTSQGFQCLYPLISEPYLLEFTCDDCSIFVKFERSDGSLHAVLPN